MLEFIYIVVFLFSVIIHEIAHAYVAHLRGDDTAKAAGRITLNPVPHIDIFGSIILPAVLVLTKAPIIFGWAKPVPVNYARLKNPKIDIPLVSAAGPLSNIALAVIAGIGIRAVRMFPEFYQGTGASIELVLSVVVLLNIILPIINLIPIPPLDGSKVITYFMPPHIAYKYLNINPFFSFLVLVILLLSGVIWAIAGPVIEFFVKVIIGGPAV